MLIILLILGIKNNQPSAGLQEIAKKEIIIGDKRIIVEVADDEKKRAAGLSGKKSLGENEGMLFLYDEPGIYGFWMRGMNFSIDFIWINENKVIDITENAPQPKSNNEELIIYEPSGAINKVLEVNAGWIEKNNIKIGDEVSIKNYKK